ncbi:MAG: DEAD/DEAH box helicase family protein [Bacillota bacterium]
MKVKKYVGDTIQDTIFKVKADLGADAIILNTRKYTKGGFLGLKIFGEKKVEVLAALEDEKDEDNEKTLAEINDLKNMVSNLEKGWKKEEEFKEKLNEEVGELYDHLLLQGVEKEFCKNIINKIAQNTGEDENLTKVKLDDLKRELLKIIGDGQGIKINKKNKVVAFIGPTGVGKTTTIAKLAAKFSLEKDIEVGMITADTYRIAAVQQLKTYSDIMNIPLKVVYNEDELKETMNSEFADRDLILLDTAGSSWSDKMQLGRLKSFTNKKLIDETHLLLSLNTKKEDIDKILNRFSNLDADKIILTKIDETTSYGDLINIRKNYDLPYSYITFGQDVPDDICEAKKEDLLKYLLGDKNE